MAKQETQGTTNGLSSASREVVSSTRKWATAMRDISLAPAVDLMEQHRATEPVLRPWLEATRTTHDWLWTTWESAATQIIDHGCTVLERTRL